MRLFPHRLSGLIGLRLLLPLSVLILVLGGCTTASHETASTRQVIIAVASLKVHVPSPVEAAAGNEIRCQIQSIDGTAVSASDDLSPGKHRLIVTLESLKQEFVGEVELIIPEPRNYRLKAERKDDAFTLSLVEVESSRTVATSTATAAPRMKFLVFVIQK